MNITRLSTKEASEVWESSNALWGLCPHMHVWEYSPSGFNFPIYAWHKIERVTNPDGSYQYLSFVGRVEAYTHTLSIDQAEYRATAQLIEMKSTLGLLF